MTQKLDLNEKLSQCLNCLLGLRTDLEVTEISPNLLYLCIPNLLIIIIVEAIFPLATVITIQSTGKSQSGF